MGWMDGWMNGVWADVGDYLSKGGRERERERERESKAVD
jgi:hypothetical protein